MITELRRSSRDEVDEERSAYVDEYEEWKDSRGKEVEVSDGTVTR